jgi:hypothetical protein
MLRAFLILAALCIAGPAFAQGTVQQSGAIVPFDTVVWQGNGVVQDGGNPAAPAVGQLGVYSGIACPLAVDSLTSPGPTTSPYGQFSICQTTTTTTVQVQGVNGNANPSLVFSVPGGMTLPDVTNLAITPPNNGQGIVITQTGSGAGPSTIDGQIAFNGISVYSDSVTGGANFVDSLIMLDGVNAGFTGGREVFAPFLIIHGPSASGNLNRNYVTVAPVAGMDGGDGGINLTTGAKGALFTFGGQATLCGTVFLGGNCTGTTPSTNMLEVTWAEANVGMYAGSSAKLKFGLSIADAVGDAVHGSTGDAELNLSNQTNLGWNYGIQFDAYNSYFPVDSTGTMIGTDGSTNTVANGVDFSSLTFTGCSFKSSVFCVDGTGDVDTALDVHAGYLTSASNVAIDIGNGRSNSGNVWFDLMAQTGDTTSDARILRGPGANGTLSITQAGTGPIAFYTNGASGNAGAGGTTALLLNNTQGVEAGAQLYPGAPAGGLQTGGGLTAGTGNPSNTAGNNGDFYFRTDCTHGSTDCTWHKEGGTWYDLN